VERGHQTNLYSFVKFSLLIILTKYSSRIKILLVYCSPKRMFTLMELSHYKQLMTLDLLHRRKMTNRWQCENLFVFNVSCCRNLHHVYLCLRTFPRQFSRGRARLRTAVRAGTYCLYRFWIQSLPCRVYSIVTALACSVWSPRHLCTPPPPSILGT
jgi:hypothetical protein